MAVLFFLSLFVCFQSKIFRMVFFFSDSSVSMINWDRLSQSNTKTYTHAYTCFAYNFNCVSHVINVQIKIVFFYINLISIILLLHLQIAKRVPFEHGNSYFWFIFFSTLKSGNCNRVKCDWHSEQLIESIWMANNEIGFSLLFYKAIFCMRFYFTQ